MSDLQITAEPGTPMLTITREFDAPRDLVFRAHTDPDLLVQWLGPCDLSMRIERYQPRDGGSWRYVHVDADGNEYGFHGVFHGTPSVEQGIVQTFEFEGVPGHVSMETMTFTEQNGKTVLHSVSSYQSVADRDGHVQSGMEHGIRDSYAKLDELLGKLAPATTA